MTAECTFKDDAKAFEAQIDGETIHWDQGLTYARHLQTEQLLSSQCPVSDKPDEMLFIVMHQAMELWIKLLLHECNRAVEYIRADNLAETEKTLDRMATVMRHMIQSWEVLATLTPHEFLTFRDSLGKASGFQSHQYRELEFRLGLKRPELVQVHKFDDEKRQALETALSEPSLYDEVLKLLARNDFEIPADHLDRDHANPYTPNDAVEDAWLAIYSDVEKHWPLYSLGEKVTALEYYFQEWRFKHMKTVSRVIGDKPGTGGSSGVGYLVKALELRFFPELWTMRSRMTTPVSASSSAGVCPV